MPVFETLLYLYTIGLFLWLSILDFRTRTVPNYLTIGGYPVFIFLLVVSSAHASRNGSEHLIRAGLGALILLVFFLIFWGIRPENLGVGDLKVAPLLGAILAWGSWDDFGLGLLICFLTNGIAALFLLLSKKANRQTHLPLIPFMLAGITVVEISIFT